MWSFYLQLSKLLAFSIISASYVVSWSSSSSRNVKQEDLVHSKCKNPGQFALTFGKTTSLYMYVFRLFNRKIAFFLDDGPAPGTTEAVLDILKANNVTATFFVCGQTYSDLSKCCAENCSGGTKIQEICHR